MNDQGNGADEREMDGVEETTDGDREAILAAPTLRPSIIIQAGLQPWIVDQAEEILIARAPELRIFQRGSEVIRVITLDREVASGGLRRPLGTVQVESLPVVYLQDVFDRLINFQRYSDSKLKSVDCPAKIPATYLSRTGDWRLPRLTGFIEAPIMRPDGSILTQPGYDPSTGLFLIGGEWPAVPTAPTRAAARAALALLIEPFAEFPFIDGLTGSHLSVLLAAILTAVQRRLLDFAPLFGFSAPAQRSGKSLLAESIALLALGRKSAATAAATDGNEFRKAITAALHEGQSIVNLDNVIYPLGSPDLARALTQEIYADRLLGSTRMLRLPTNVLWTATGNNLAFKGDMPSRALVCRIDPGVERPEERSFKIANLPAYLLENRKRLVAAALTILRAYQAAGRPKQKVPPWGGFDEWSRNIREALVWLGLPDPCMTRDQIVLDDPDRESEAGVVLALYDAFGDQGKRSGEMITEAGDNAQLKESLLTVAATRGDSKTLDPRRLSHFLRRVEGRIYDGVRLVRAGTKDRAVIWRLERLVGAPPRRVTTNAANGKPPSAPPRKKKWKFAR